jgi:hypothetical protein
MGRATHVDSINHVGNKIGESLELIGAAGFPVNPEVAVFDDLEAVVLGGSGRVVGGGGGVRVAL